MSLSSFHLFPETLLLRAEAYALFGLLVLFQVCPGVPGGLPWEWMAPDARGLYLLRRRDLELEGSRWLSPIMKAGLAA